MSRNTCVLPFTPGLWGAPVKIARNPRTQEFLSMSLMSSSQDLELCISQKVLQNSHQTHAFHTSIISKTSSWYTKWPLFQNVNKLHSSLWICLTFWIERWFCVFTCFSDDKINRKACKFFRTLWSLWWQKAEIPHSASSRKNAIGSKMRCIEISCWL